MSRRDTIIIAVLINAGLLILLFATSLKSDYKEESSIVLAPPPAATVVEEEKPVAMQTETPPVVDEVENAIRQYSTPIAAADPAPVKPDFTQDLQAIGGMQSPSLPAEAPVEKESGYKEVKVKKGDVLERIARQNRVSVEEIMKINNLSSTRLKIGQTLKIPTKKGSSLSPPRPLTQAGEESSQYYTIKNGDNPWTIAVKNHMKVEDLLKLNNLDEEKARRLKPGDKIRIK